MEVLMLDIVSGDEWNIVQKGFDRKKNRIYESIFSLANGYMGGRGNFEEGYSGDTLKSFFQAGVYYPDDALFGWYKIGYPKHNNKVINSTDIIGIKIFINNERLDLAKNKFTDFKRVLNMKNGLLSRYFILVDSKGNKTEFLFKRFLSIHNQHLLAISLKVKAINYSGLLEIEPYMDGSIVNEDARSHKGGFWSEVNKDSDTLVVKTDKTNFYLATSMDVRVYQDGFRKNIQKEIIEDDRYLGNKYRIDLKENCSTEIEKLVCCYNSRRFNISEVSKRSKHSIESIYNYKFKDLAIESEKEWKKKWEIIDIKIKGDLLAQQSIRFNLFTINSTLTGEDPTLNISPKGFTGELYSGSTYWDTEIYCFPFFMLTEPKMAKNLLLYRYRHLKQAIKNARSLKLKGALYPMITIDGNEGHAEWEITLIEIHRDSAIAYAIYDYIRYTGDLEYMEKYGFEVIGNIARFWANRVTYDKSNDRYSILGVTGPDEFHNNVNNNWYTNLMAKWILQYAFEQSDFLRSCNKKNYSELKNKYGFSKEEFNSWRKISDNIYLPKDKSTGIFPQFDGYFNTEQITVEKIPKEEIPIVQSWSWDRINRSSLIKQADVVLGLFNLSELFSHKEKLKNFEYYLARTVHESSLSPSIYSIIAAEVGKVDVAYDLFIRSSRIDLNNYNNDTEHGLHVTSMCGSWLSIIKGFLGLKILNNCIILNPFIPKKWISVSVRLSVLNRVLDLEINKYSININLISGSSIKIRIQKNLHKICKKKKLVVNYKSPN
jgi:maltose phosphorylase